MSSSSMPHPSRLAFFIGTTASSRAFWTSQNSIGQFQIYSNSNYMVGDINRDGRDEVVVQNPFNLYVGIFEWDLRAQLSLVSQVYNRVPAPDGQTAWVLSGADQMQIACPGAHIFAFNHADGYMGVFEWRLTGLTCIWSANNQIASPPAPWQVDNQTKYLVNPGHRRQCRFIPSGLQERHSFP